MLISAKTHCPKAPRHNLAREQLSQTLSRAIEYPLTTIGGSAGFGKTTLISHWLSTQNITYAWFSLDPSDNDAGQFAAYFAASLNLALPKDLKLSDHSQTQHSLDLKTFFIQILNEFETITEPLFVVLDDIHLVTNEEILTNLRFLISHLPSHLHFICVARGMPNLGVGKMRVRGQVLEITGQDLAFTQHESDLFLRQQLAFDVSPRQLEHLHHAIAGWASALQLVTLSAADTSGLDQVIDEVSHGHTYVLEYLAEEAIRDVPDDTLNFLYTTSVLGRFNSALAAQLSGVDKAQRLLEELEHKGLFLTALDKQRQWYRYHPLFANFLQHQLSLQGPDKVRHMQSLASAAWADQGYPREALKFANLAADQSRITNLLSDHGRDFLHQGHFLLLQQSFELLDSQLVASLPTLTLLRAWMAQQQFAFDDVEPLLASAEQHLDHHNDTKNQQILAEFKALRAQVAMNLGRLDEASDLAQQALKQEPALLTSSRTAALSVLGEASFVKGHLVDAQTQMVAAEQQARIDGAVNIVLWALCQQSEISMAQGFLQKALQIQDKALDYAKLHQVQNIPLMEFVHRVKGQILWEWHHLDAAQESTENGLKILQQQDPHWHLQSYALLAQINQDKGKREPCEGYLTQLTKMLADQHHLDWQANAHAALMSWWEATNDQESAAAWLQTAPEISYPSNHFQQCNGRNHVRAHVLLQQWDEARSILDKLHQPAVKHQLVMDQNRNHIYYSLLCWRCKDIESCHRHLKEALHLASSTGAINSFIRLGKVIIVMLKSLASTGVLGALPAQRSDRIIQLTQQHQDYSGKLHVQLDEEVVKGILKSDHLPELIKHSPLTKREWQVLKLIHIGLSNDKIANHMDVAPSTLKTHIRSLYQKLQVDDRKQAIALASDLLHKIQGD